MNIPEPKLIAALRGKSIVPEIKLAKPIEMAKKLNLARPAKFPKLNEVNHD